MPGTAAHPRARYTKEQKAQAVTAALTSSTEAAAEQTGIPRSTLRYWLEHPEFAELRQTTRDALAEQMWATIQIGVAEVARGIKDADTPFRDKVIALGVLYDKHALLTGAATSRSESRDLTGTLSDAELVAAVREAERLASGEGASPEAAGASAGE